MAEYKVEIINGKEYGVYVDDEGIPMILGDPQKDQAEAIAKAVNKKESIFNPDDLHKHFVDDEPKPTFNYPTNNDLEEMDRLSPSEIVIEQMRKNGDYDIDPRFNAPRYYEGTSIPTEEYIMYMNDKSNQDLIYGDKLRQRRKLINGLIIGFAIGIPATLFLGYIIFKSIQMFN